MSSLTTMVGLQTDEHSMVSLREFRHDEGISLVIGVDDGNGHKSFSATPPEMVSFLTHAREAAKNYID